MLLTIITESLVDVAQIRDRSPEKSFHVVTATQTVELFTPGACEDGEGPGAKPLCSSVF